jgi:histone-lysine N-methyltransferase SETD2
LAYKDKENYTWAVKNLKTLFWHPKQTPKVFITNRDNALQNALAKVFPHSQANLCTWHNNKNITTNCKKHFTSSKSKDSWEKFSKLGRNITYSKTKNQYHQNFSDLEGFLATRPAVLEHIKNSIVPVKEHFEVAWALQHPHLRNLNSTSRVELGQAYIKSFLKNSTGDLLLVFNSLALAVDAQINHVHKLIGKDTINLLVNVPKIFIPILGKISLFAIQKCLSQFHRLSKMDPTDTCSKTHLKGVGIPCTHWLAEILECGQSLMPNEFHLQWHLSYNPKSTVSCFFFSSTLINQEKIG